MAADTRKQQLIAAWLAWLAHLASLAWLAWLAWLARGLSNFFHTLDHVWKLLTCNALPVHLLRQVQTLRAFRRPSMVAWMLGCLEDLGTRVIGGIGGIRLIGGLEG